MKLTATLAWRYLRGRGARSLLTTLAVVLGVMLTFGLNGILPAMVDAFTRNLLVSAGKVDLTVTTTDSQPFSADVVDRLLTVPQIAVASPSAQGVVPLPHDANAPADALAQVIVVGLDLGTAPKLRDFTVTSGRMLNPADATSVVMNADLADELGLGVGDDLVLPSAGGTSRYRVVGLLDAVTLPGSEQVYLTLPAAQQLFGIGDRVTQIDAAFTSGADRVAVERAVTSALGPGYQVGGVATESSLLASLQVSNWVCCTDR